jgi:anti-sigma B factor antagonist
VTNPGADFELYESTEAGVPVLVVRGEVDLATAPDLREKLLSLADEGARVVVVDLSGVSFMDSSALGALVSAMTRFRANGGGLRLVVTAPHISKVLEITGLSDVFPIYGTTVAAAP